MKSLIQRELTRVIREIATGYVTTWEHTGGHDGVGIRTWTQTFNQIDRLFLRTVNSETINKHKQW